MRWGAEFMRTMEEVMADAPKFSLPVLILHGKSDMLIPYEGSQCVGAPRAASLRLLLPPGSCARCYRASSCLRAYLQNILRHDHERGQDAPVRAPPRRWRGHARGHARTSARATTRRLYDGAHHEVLFDPTGQALEDEIIAWLGAHARL
jgi:alpha-beta hydrolase superfamily lysophospholipase